MRFRLALFIAALAATFSASAFAAPPAGTMSDDGRGGNAGTGPRICYQIAPDIRWCTT